MKAKKNREHYVGVFFDKETYEKLKKISYKLDRSLSSMVRIIVIREIKRIEKEIEEENKNLI